MPDFTKFEVFPYHLLLKKHDFETDEFRLVLTNSEPDVAVDEVLSDIDEITAENGYSAGGEIVVVYVLLDQGVSYVNADDVEFVADADPDGFGPFQWGVLYNNTTAEKFLVGYCAFADPVTVALGALYRVSFSTEDGLFKIV